MAGIQQDQGAQNPLPISELGVALFVMLVLAIIISELPPVMLDFCISINILLGIILIMMSLYVERPLDMASFPSVILIGTLFRLSLSIAATRSILAHGEAGDVIHSFAQFVTGGNLIVGVIIFAIITVVNFMVITKGSERIAEVSARFALDAMPGKQMTIDADFNQGLISPQEAVQKRTDLQRECALFGSMDGAMKFVKGDAIASIIICFINIIAGLCIGVLMVGLPIDAAVDKYTNLTIGEALAAQLPALLMSISCGLTMSRTTGEATSLGKDLSTQLMAKPYSLFFTLLFLIMIILTSGFTGLPWFPFFVFAIIIGFLTFAIYISRGVQEQLSQLDSVKRSMNDLTNPNKMYERLGVDILGLQVGTDLLRIADPEQNGQLLAKIAALRQRMTDQLGYIMPNIRIMDSTSIGVNEYLISIRNNPVSVGTVYPDRLMIVADVWDSLGKPPPADALVGKHPINEIRTYWIRPDQVAESDGITSSDPVDVVVNHLEEITIKYVDEIMTKTDVLKLMSIVQNQDQSLVQDLVPAIISTSDLRKIFVNLIKEKVSIKDILFVFERLCDYARFSKEPDILSERLRAALGRQICLTHADDETNTLFAVTLSSEWERTLDESCTKTEIGTMFLLNPHQVQELIETTAMTLHAVYQSLGQNPVILCSPKIRLPLFQLLERHIPSIAVMSYSELVPDIPVESVGIIGDNY